MYLAEDPTHVGEFGQRPLGEGHIYRVAPPRGQIGEIADVELQPDLGGFCTRPGPRHRLGGWIDGEDRRSGVREFDGAGAVAAAQLEDPLAGDIAEQFSEDEVTSGHARRPYWDARPLEPMDPRRFYTLRVVKGTDYSLARRAVLRDLRAGRVSRNDVCDAHPELLRAARNIGERVGKNCPVCRSKDLFYVSYVYGDRLRSANGRALSQPGELDELARKHAEFDCYVVEVCTKCRWNHLGRRELHGTRT